MSLPGHWIQCCICWPGLNTWKPLHQVLRPAGHENGILTMSHPELVSPMIDREQLVIRRGESRDDDEVSWLSHYWQSSKFLCALWTLVNNEHRTPLDLVCPGKHSCHAHQLILKSWGAAPTTTWQCNKCDLDLFSIKSLFRFHILTALTPSFFASSDRLQSEW